jgi:hypothetical protein
MNPIVIANTMKDERATALVYAKESAIIADAAGASLAADRLAFVQSVQRGIESARAEMLRPLNQSARDVRDAFDKLLTPIVEAERAIKTAIRAWRDRLEDEKRARRSALADAAAQQAAADAKMAGLGDAEAGAIAASAARGALATPVEPPARVVAGRIGTAATRKVWTFEVTHPMQVPREFLKVDEVAIREAVNGGARTIAGVRIFQDEIIVGGRKR